MTVNIRMVPVNRHFRRGDSIFQRVEGNKAKCVQSSHDFDLVGAISEFGEAVPLEMLHPSSVEFEYNLTKVDPTAARRDRAYPTKPIMQGNEHAGTRLNFSNGWTVSMLCYYTGSTEIMAFRTDDKTAFELPELSCNGDQAAQYIQAVANFPDTSFKVEHENIEWVGNVARMKGFKLT